MFIFTTYYPQLDMNIINNYVLLFKRNDIYICVCVCVCVVVAFKKIDNYL